MKSRELLGVFLKNGWFIKRETGSSHKILSKPGVPSFSFCFHKNEEIGPRMISRIVKKTGLPL